MKSCAPSLTVLVFVFCVVIATGAQDLPTAKSRHGTSAAESGNDAGLLPIANAERLRAFESAMDRYYRDDPLERTRESLQQEIKKYNRWVEAAFAKKKATIAALNKQVGSLRALDKLTGEMDAQLGQKPDVSDQEAVDAHNSLVDERNERVREYNELAKLHQNDKQAYDAVNEQFDRQAESRKADLEALRQEYKAECEAHREWFTTGRDLELFKELNGFFAALCDERKNDNSPELAGTIVNTRAIRRELFEHTVATHERMETGAVVVEARLCDRESCFLLADTGAMSVTIPLSLVDALGLNDCLGDEIDVAVAGGGRVRGRELTIPQLAVQGHEVKDVKAIVLDEFDAGVDGLLGLSFLKHFTIRIEPRQQNRLVIEPQSGG